MESFKILNHGSQLSHISETLLGGMGSQISARLSRLDLTCPAQELAIINTSVLGYPSCSPTAATPMG